MWDISQFCFPVLFKLHTHLTWYLVVRSTQFSHRCRKSSRQRCMFLAATMRSMKWRVVIFTTSEKISSKSTAYSCLNPFATNLALYFGLGESDVYLVSKPICTEDRVDFLVIRPSPKSCLPKWSSSPTPSPNAMWPNRGMFYASSYDVGSPTSVKKIPGEYLSGGCDNLSDLRGMTGLVAPGVGWSKAEPFDNAESVDLVQEFSVTHETDLVLWAKPSWRVGTSEKITLRTSIVLSTVLCIADSLNTTSELQTIWVLESVSDRRLVCTPGKLIS